MENKSLLEITDKLFYEDNDFDLNKAQSIAVSYTHLRAHET